jgi:hypothetical protein
MREAPYVMATRDRESNLLYVDTMYDPDVPTGHEPPAAVDPSLVLQQVLTRPSADLTATEMRRRERDNSVNSAASGSPWGRSSSSLPEQASQRCSTWLGNMGTREP